MYGRGPAFAGPLLFFIVLSLVFTSCQREATKEERYESLKLCVNTYWEKRAKGEVWREDTDSCCATVEIEQKNSGKTRIDPIASQIVVERFNLTDLIMSDDLTTGTVSVWLEYSIPVIPTSLNKTITEKWDWREGCWRRRASNLNAVLAGASSGSD